MSTLSDINIASFDSNLQFILITTDAKNHILLCNAGVCGRVISYKIYLVRGEWRDARAAEQKKNVVVTGVSAN